MGLTVIGVFTNSSAAMQAIDQLIHQGILPTNIEQTFQSGTPIREDGLVTDQPTTENSLPPEPLVEDTDSVMADRPSWATSTSKAPGARCIQT